jgi:glutamyl-tRNA synthetase
MHIGNLRTALYGYLFAKQNNGSFVLRIEDTDQERFVEGATNVIYNTLKMANLLHDEGPDIGGQYSPYIQSERKHIYMEYAQKLIERDAAYYCFCTKEQIEAQKTEDGYNRKCRTLPKDIVEQQLKQDMPYVIRQKIPINGTTSYEDIVFGKIEIENRLLDDQILLKSDGMPTYNFANVVDDYLMHISHIMRGSEYISSTPKYVLLYQSFGWDIPKFVHLPLIMGKNDDGSIGKLSKRHGSTGFQDLIDEGYLPQAIVNYIALLGWSPKDDKEIFTLPELIERFDLNGLNKHPAVFDYQKLNWVNSEHIKQLPFDIFCELALPFAKIKNTPLYEKWTLIAQLLYTRLHRFSEIPEMISFLHKLQTYDKQLFINKKNKSTVESSLVILKESFCIIEHLKEWSEDILHTEFEEMAQRKELKFGSLMWSLRIALSGLMVTPGGAIEIMLIIGKEESLRRIEYAIKMLEKQK